MKVSRATGVFTFLRTKGIQHNPQHKSWNHISQHSLRNFAGAWRLSCDWCGLTLFICSAIYISMNINTWISVHDLVGPSASLARSTQQCCTKFLVNSSFNLILINPNEDNGEKVSQSESQNSWLSLVSPFIDCQWDHKKRKENVRLTNHKEDNELLN